MLKMFIILNLSFWVFESVGREFESLRACHSNQGVIVKSTVTLFLCPVALRSTCEIRHEHMVFYGFLIPM